MFCTTGVIGVISEYGIALPVASSDEADYFEDTYCELTVENQNALKFERDCRGQGHCEENWVLPAKGTYESQCRE